MENICCNFPNLTDGGCYFEKSSKKCGKLRSWQKLPSSVCQLCLSQMAEASFLLWLESWQSSQKQYLSKLQQHLLGFLEPVFGLRV